MEESFTIPAEDGGDSELDPRIQIELEKLNAATDEINRLETELDESNTTFRMLLGEASRRLQGLAKRLGSCVERTRPYFDALEVAAKARTDCQRAAVQFQRASELHAAAKETVTLAEQRFVSKQDEWQFDSAWQEVLNHAIIKVMDAENRKAESGREHQRRALAFSAAERKVTQLEENLKRLILKSRPYFEEKKLCQEQLHTQKKKIETIQQSIADAKCCYAQSLKTLEVISEEIHRRRGEYLPCKDDGYPVGPREPGVGAEGIPSSSIDERDFDLTYDLDQNAGLSSSPDLSLTSSRDDFEHTDDSGLQELRLRVRELALRPIDGRDGESENEAWALELNETINKLDHLLMMKENTQNKKSKFTASSHATKPCDERAHLTNHEAGEAEMSHKIEEKPVDVSNELQNALPPSHLPIAQRSPQPADGHRCMMSLDVVSLARDTATIEGESFLKAVLEEKSPTGTITESTSERNDSPDEILMVECEVTDDNVQNPIIRLTNVPVSKSD